MSLNHQGQGEMHEDIQHFLTTYHRPSNGHSINDWQNQAPQNDIRSPRSGLIEPFAWPQSTDSEMSSRKNYTFSTESESSRVPSLFDGSARRGRESDSMSHPSARPAHATLSFVQQFHQQMDFLQPHPHINGPHLWCELKVPQNCPATFALDDVEGWIEHHMDHMHDQFPAACICWFCDHVVFPSQAYPLEPVSNFRLRMEHIHSHIWDEDRTLTDMRPDFHMLDHLLSIGVLTRQQRRQMSRFNELPDRLRHPGLFDGIFVPKGRAPRPAQPVLHDLDKERRAMERQRKNGRH
ncbi:hypothetical protein GQ53DRAFT_260789 [Thozetella sp. PMI_491]|nr:hypothetical protein GQ53DRAFT_260789 [Thozetella sp. PMI_491]